MSLQAGMLKRYLLLSPYMSEHVLHRLQSSIEPHELALTHAICDQDALLERIGPPYTRRASKMDARMIPHSIWRAASNMQANLSRTS